ncbi:MAG: rhamnogalacturonan acetylesterase [Pseudomonadota bacterium]
MNKLLFAALLACLAACSQAPLAPPNLNTDPRMGQNIALPEPANGKLPSLFFIGDSTVRNGRDDGQNKGAEGQWGWGNPIAALFDTSKINVVNRAIGGLSSRTYLSGGHWERTLALVKPGDFVIMQFGHNDSGAINDTKRARATLAGTGAQTEEIDNMLTKQRETVRTYGWYLRKYIAEARAKGALPIVASPVPRKRWDASGKVARSKDSHAAWAGEVARQEGAGFIDLNELVAHQYDQLGREAVMKLFPQTTPDEHTHTNLAGAELNARTVVAGLDALPKRPLRAYLRPADDVRPVVDASKVPDEAVRNPGLPTLFIAGDSTVKSGGQNGAFGWGERIAAYFDTRKLNVVNHAIGGRSSRTFYTEGRWGKLLAQVKAGDFVLVQFGHNDGGRVGDPSNKNRASGPGTGADTIEDTRPDGSRELVHSFGWYLAKYVADARAKGATVILLSPVPHRDRWEQGRDFANFAEWGAQVAQAGGARFIDLTMLVSDAYRAVGPQTVNGFFSDARTHTNDAGATFNAAQVAAGLKRLQGDPLGAYLVR